jgi:hypothetical protein
MMRQMNLGGSYSIGNTSIAVNRMGYGAMQLAGPEVWDHRAIPRERSRFFGRLSKPA